MENALIIKAYFIYLPIALGLTFYVAHTLFKTGKVFMFEIFNGREEIANATNRLFQLGFYLINIGFALWILKINSYHVDNYQDVIEALGSSIQKKMRRIEKRKGTLGVVINAVLTTLIISSSAEYATPFLSEPLSNFDFFNVCESIS